MQSRYLLLAALLVALFPAVTAAAEDRTRYESWQGYLFRAADGSVNLGWPVVAMGVMEQPSHVVGKEDAKRLAPLVTGAKDNWTFWNYDLERGNEEVFSRLPRILVRIEGEVVYERDPDEMIGTGSGGTRTMSGVKLVSAEFVTDEWLEKWAVFFKDLDSPFRIDLERPRPGEKEIRRFAPKALKTLIEMKKVEGAGKEKRALVTSIDSAAEIVEDFRRSTEASIQRWLVGADKKYTLGLEGLEKLGPLPPTGVEIQRWFLESETKAAFLEKVAERFKGELGHISLPYYEKRGRSVSYATEAVDRVRSGWSDDAYRTHRKTTREIVGR